MILKLISNIMILLCMNSDLYAQVLYPSSLHTKPVNYSKWIKEPCYQFGQISNDISKYGKLIKNYNGKFSTYNI